MIALVFLSNALLVQTPPVSVAHVEPSHGLLSTPSSTQQPSQLTEAGNGAFATIQEVVNRLNSDPRTDWTRVNLEALRSHLIDMRNFTLNVEAVSQTPVENGVRIIIRPTVASAAGSLDRVLAAHPTPLRQETGWEMQVRKEQDTYVLTVTSTSSGDIDKIRGLGYIGIMAMGSHHQQHHWLIATGANPHRGHR